MVLRFCFQQITISEKIFNAVRGTLCNLVQSSILHARRRSWWNIKWRNSRQRQLKSICQSASSWIVALRILIHTYGSPWNKIRSLTLLILWAQAAPTMCSWLIIVDTKRTKSIKLLWINLWKWINKLSVIGSLCFRKQLWGRHRANISNC